MLLIVLIVLILIIGVWGYLDLSKEKLKIEKAEEDVFEIIFKAVSYERIEICEELIKEEDVVFCKIQASGLLGDERFCYEVLDKFIFNYSKQTILSENLKNKTNEEIKAVLEDREYFELNSRDYCWLKLSISKQEDFCGEILDSEAREFCLEKNRGENEI